MPAPVVNVSSAFAALCVEPVPFKGCGCRHRVSYERNGSVVDSNKCRCDIYHFPSASASILTTSASSPSDRLPSSQTIKALSSAQEFNPYKALASPTGAPCLDSETFGFR